jgi:hypothetical protein
MEINSHLEITQQYLKALKNKQSTSNSFENSLKNQEKNTTETQLSKEI